MGEEGFEEGGGQSARDPDPEKLSSLPGHQAQLQSWGGRDEGGEG